MRRKNLFEFKNHIDHSAYLNAKSFFSEFSFKFYFQSVQAIGTNCGRTYATQATFDIKVSVVCDDIVLHFSFIFLDMFRVCNQH